MSLQWHCQRCLEPVNDGDGYLHVDVRDALAAKARWKSWEHRHPRGTLVSGRALAELPRLAGWAVHHRRCDPLPDELGDYWIGTERARTHAAILEWTLHLEAKSWYRGTNWADFVRHQALAAADA